MLGRTDFMVTVRGTNVYQSAVENLLAQVKGVSMHYELRLSRSGDNDAMTVHFEPAPSAGADSDAWQDIAARASDLIHQALHVRLECRPVPPGTLPRYDLKTKRMIDERPKAFRRELDR